MLKVKKRICEILVAISFTAALLFVSAVSHGDMDVLTGFWRICVALIVMTAAAWKRGWLR